MTIKYQKGPVAMVREKTVQLFMLYIMLLALLIPGCEKHKPAIEEKASQEKYMASVFAMGTVEVQFTLYGREKGRGEEDIQACIKEIQRLEMIMSRYKPDSTISRVNSLKAGEEIKVEPEFIEILSLVKTVYERTEGRFDPTVGPLINLWKEAGEKGKLPCQEEIIQVSQSIGFDNVEIKKDSVLLNKEVTIDLGGIAKGYIVDQLVELLKIRGVNAGLVNAGGDLKVFGTKEGDFKIGIQNPNDKAGIIKKVIIQKGSFVTSGSYERFSMIQGKKYSHIIDPVTGYPVDNDLQSVSVTADSAALADAYATGIFVLGFEKGKELLLKDDTIGGYLLSVNGEEWEEKVDR